MSNLCFDTHIFPESTNGLLLCGINWGGDPDDSSQVDASKYHYSFFSDCDPLVINNCRYRNRIISWFYLFGHPLATKKGKEGVFERSISQTNWLPTQSRNMADLSIRNALTKEIGLFLQHLEFMKPRVLIFISTKLLRAFNDPKCLERAEEILGQGEPHSFVQKTVKCDGKQLTAFKVGFQDFQNCRVIALPHPASKRGVDDKYITAFAPEIGEILSDYKKMLGYN